jgi:hypothetical protein
VEWLEDLYTRVQDDLKAVSLYELVTLTRLYDEGWLPESLAVNMAYKMYDALGRDTTGIIDH